jgi:hypothetical protein
MTSIIKVDQIQTLAGTAPTAADLGINVTGSVLQVHYAKLSTAVAASAASYDVITTTFTPKSATSTLLVEAQVFMGATTVGNLDGGVKVLRDGTAIDTGADSDSGRGGADVLDSSDDLWTTDDGSKWFRMKLGGAITTPANSTVTSTFVVRFQAAVVTTINVNRSFTGTAMRGISYLKIMEIAG